MKIHKWAIPVLLMGSTMSSAFAANSCPNGGPSISDLPLVNGRTKGFCRIMKLDMEYKGSAVIGSAPIGDEFGHFDIDYDLDCLLPPNPSSNPNEYVLNMLDFRPSRFERSSKEEPVQGQENVATNVPGIDYVAPNWYLGGMAGFSPLATVGDEYAKTDHVITQRTRLDDGGDYYCGRFTGRKSNIKVVRGPGAELVPNIYMVDTVGHTQHTYGHWSGAGTIFIGESSLPPALVEVKAATCRLERDDYHVAVNNNSPMNVKDFDRIATDFDIPLLCDPFEADVAYKLTVNNNVGRLNEGVFGLSATEDMAKGVAYQLRHIGGDGQRTLVDFTKSKQLSKKENSSTSYHLKFSVSPIKIDSIVTSGEANASLTLEMIYE